MTEQEWLDSSDPGPLWSLVRKKATQRKTRLLQANFWRWRAADLDEKDGQSLVKAVVLAEQWADEGKRPAEAGRRHDKAVLSGSSKAALDSLISSMKNWRVTVRKPAARQLVGLFRDTFPNPFRRITLRRQWRSPTVLSLAQAIYDERAFERLPILADALEEAGCTQMDLLQHLRKGGEHVRGCWALDLVLRRK